ncbi:hypothetical protein F2P81_009090 [Scophthalmus maximus]|uniref:EF-hand domain-containing protein n=1 Tax=Scophthalmus maximus TaxID=52904 RepID=A0A6A4STP9_SCOMX|nr:hypothetical protein F2P81_009090 [Scophthalmus maximus]
MPGRVCPLLLCLTPRFYTMSTATNTFEKVKAVILSAHKSSSLGEKVNFYNSWAENYDQDVAVLEYRAPSLAANSISSHFSGDREEAVMLDVACGTGLVAKQMKTHGFGHFVGVDGSEAMLEIARESGLYQDLKQALLGEDPLPVQWVDSFDVVVIIGALSEGQVQVCVVRELCKSTKPGMLLKDAAALEYRAGSRAANSHLLPCSGVTVKELWDRILDGGLLCHGALCQSRIVHDLWSELGSHSCQCRPRDVQRLQNQAIVAAGLGISTAGMWSGIDDDHIQMLLKIREKMPFHHVRAGLLYPDNYLSSSLTEGSEAFQLTSLSTEELGEIREAFRVLDRDGNGFISKQELGMAMRSLGYMPSEVELAIIMQRLDMDEPIVPVSD